MSWGLRQLRRTGRRSIYGPAFDATAPFALKLSNPRLTFIGLFFLAVTPSVNLWTAGEWVGAMVLMELMLRQTLKWQVQGGTPAMRPLRIVLSLASNGGWIVMGAVLWLRPEAHLRLAAMAVWTGLVLYAQTACSRFPGHFVLIGGPAVAALVLAPLLTPHIPLSARITIEGAVGLCLIHTASSALSNYRQHQRLERATEELTAQRRAAEDANQAKSDFLAMVSHELRTPLNGVLGLAHALGAAELTPKQQALLEGILRSGDGLMSILNDVLDLSKIEAGRMEICPAPTDVHLLAEEVRALFQHTAASKGVNLRLTIDPATPRWMMVDPLRLKQVLMNLVSNALKFTKEGEVEMSLDLGMTPEFGRRAVFRVDDTGPGLSDAARAKLFERFSQGGGHVALSHGGTGLGLALSRDLAQAMEGQLSLKDKDGPGACFELNLPLRPCEAPARPETPSALEAMRVPLAVGVSILVAEDNPTNRAVVKALLEPTGWRLTFAENGAQALDTLNGGGPFDLVLMDVRMPVMDGRAALAEIRAGRAGDPDIPVIALTADAMAGRAAELLETGFDGYVEKPIRPQLLVAAVQAALTTGPGSKAGGERLLA